VTWEPFDLIPRIPTVKNGAAAVSGSGAIIFNTEDPCTVQNRHIMSWARWTGDEITRYQMASIVRRSITGNTEVAGSSDSCDGTTYTVIWVQW